MYYEYASKNHPGGVADPTEGKLFPFQPQILAGAMFLYSTFTKVPPLAIKSDSLFYMKLMSFTPTGIRKLSQNETVYATEDYDERS